MAATQRNIKIILCFYVIYLLATLVYYVIFIWYNYGVQ